MKNIPSTGTAVNKAGDGGTIICGSNAAGEPLPPHIQFSTDASSPENIRMNVEWVEGMPRVYVQFGCGERQWFSTTFNSNEAGSMNAEELLKYFEINVFPLYPDAADVPGKRVLIKIDGGPGRLHFLMLLSLPPSRPASVAGGGTCFAFRFPLTSAHRSGLKEQSLIWQYRLCYWDIVVASSTVHLLQFHCKESRGTGTTRGLDVGLPAPSLWTIMARNGLGGYPDQIVDGEEAAGHHKHAEPVSFRSEQGWNGTPASLPGISASSATAGACSPVRSVISTCRS